MSTLERTIEELRALGRTMKPGECLELRPIIPPDVQAQLDSRTDEERAKDEALFDAMIDEIYADLGVTVVRR